jgi:hypothetical protein
MKSLLTAVIPARCSSVPYTSGSWTPDFQHQLRLVTQTASSIEHGRPKEIARDLACSPLSSSQTVQTPLSGDDSFYFPIIGNDGHISTPRTPRPTTGDDIYSATPRSKAKAPVAE